MRVVYTGNIKWLTVLYVNGWKFFWLCIFSYNMEQVTIAFYLASLFLNYKEY